MRYVKKLFALLLVLAVLPHVALAHSGRTDSSGGHKDNKNKSGLGSYHYHCGGHPAHLHDGGACPYSVSSALKEDDSPKAAKTPASTPKPVLDWTYDEYQAYEDLQGVPLPLQKGDKNESVALVQQRLIDLYYLSGSADGAFGKHTQSAVRRFQADYGFETDGIVTEEIFIALMHWTYAE